MLEPAVQAALCALRRWARSLGLTSSPVHESVRGLKENLLALKFEKKTTKSKFISI